MTEYPLFSKAALEALYAKLRAEPLGAGELRPITDFGGFYIAHAVPEDGVWVKLMDLTLQGTDYVILKKMARRH